MNELLILAAVTTFTGLMWIPYVLDRISRQGLLATVGYTDAPQHSAWGKRAMRAHRNAIENLLVFSTLIFILYMLDAFGPVSFSASLVYAAARAVHYTVYILGIPWLRTGAFFAGFIAQMTLAVEIISR